MFRLGDAVLVPHPESPDPDLDIRGTIITISTRGFHVLVLNDDGTEDLLILSRHDLEKV